MSLPKIQFRKKTKNFNDASSEDETEKLRPFNLTKNFQKTLDQSDMFKTLKQQCKQD